MAAEDIHENIHLAMQGEILPFMGLGEIDKVKKHFEDLWAAGAAGKAKAFTNAGMGIGAGALGLGAIAVKEAVEVESASKRVEAVYQVNQKAMGAYGSWVQSHSAGLLQSQKSLFEGLGQVMSQFGGNVNQQFAEQVLSGASKVALVFKTTLPDAIKPAAVALKDFHQGVSTTFDLMSTAASKVQGGWAALFGGQTNRIMGLASSAGLGLQDTLTAAVDIGQQYGGGRAMSGIAALISRIDTLKGGAASLRSGGLVGTLQGLFAHDDQATLHKLFTGSSFQYAQSIAGGTASLGGSQGFLGGAFGKLSAEMPEQMKKLQLEAQNTAIAVGKVLVPALITLMGTISPIATQMAAWMQSHPQLAAGIIKVGLAIGGLSLAVRAGMAAFQLLGLMLSPGGLVILGLAGVAFGLYLLYTRVETFRKGVNSIRDSIEFGILHPMQALQGALTWLQGHWLQAAFLLLAGPYVAFVTFITSRFFPQFYGAFNSGFATVQGWLTGTWSKLYTNIVKPLVDAINWAKDWGGKFVGAIVSGISSAYNKLPGPMRDLLDKVYSPLAAFSSTMFHLGANWVANLANGVTSAASSVTNAVSNAVNGATSGPTARDSYGRVISVGNATSVPDRSGYTAPGSTFGNFGGITSDRVAPSWYLPGGGTGGSVRDTDYAGVNQKVYLPGKGQYTYLGGQYKPGMGTAEYFRTPNGGEIGFNHLLQGTIFGGGNMNIGQKVSGGAYVGLSDQPTDPKYGYGYHLCVVTDAKGRSYLAYLNTAQVKQTGAISLDGSASASAPSTSSLSLPTLATTGTDHTGQAGWVMGANGKWQHVAKPGSGKYTWDAANNTWVLSSTYSAIQDNQNWQRAEGLQRHGLEWAYPSGMNLSKMPAGMTVDSWLKAQYKINELKREEWDQTARIAFLRHEITKDELNAILAQDNQAKNQANQSARARTQAGGGSSGGAGVARVRIVDQCAETGRANVLRQKSADAAKLGADAAKGAEEILKQIHAGINHTNSLIGQLLKINPGLAEGMNPHLNGLGIIPAHGS